MDGVYIFVLILSVLFVLASVLFPVPIYSEADLVQVQIGWPLGFVVQNQSGYAFMLEEPLSYKPPLRWQTHLYSVWENTTQILWLQFFLDIVIIFGALILVLNLVKVISLRTRKR